MQLSAILFDLDGTLVSSNAAQARAWARAFGDSGIRVPFEQIRSLIGMSADKIIARLAPGLSSAKGDAVKRARKDALLSKYLADVRPTPGAKELITLTRARGLKLALASSAEHDEVEALFRAGGLEGCFDATATGSDSANGTSYPDIVQAALDRLGVQHGEAVMVGDTPYDIEAALRARVPCIALRCGGWPDSALRGASAIFDDPSDLSRRYPPLGEIQTTLVA